MPATKDLPPYMIPLKQWQYEEATRQGVNQHTIEMRWHRGKFPRLRASCVAFNQKVKYVDPRIGPR